MGTDDPTLDATAPASASASLPGDAPRAVGPYRVLQALGEGGFGTVYLAEQHEPVRRRVALKVLKPGMDSKSVIARFEAERQALALMDHPGVAKVYDAGTTPEGRPYFAMEHVRGEPINVFCEHERLGVDDRVRLMIQVCEAVQHAHMKGVIHRDLKPGNVLVSLVDGRPAPKVIDFGVAKAVSQRLTDSTVYTEVGQLIGTPEYMSPEQARGGSDVDTRADVYSLGAILYELLTGGPPLDSARLRAGGYAGVSRAIDELEPVRPSERITRAASAVPPRLDDDPATVARRLRGDLDWIVMRSLEKDRTRRYDGASALARDLERYLRDEPVEAGPPTAAYRLAKFLRRNRGGVTAAGAVALALLLGVAGTTAGFVWALHERDVARELAASEREARDESDAVVAFLGDMLASVDPTERGRDVTVRDVLDEASSSIPARFAGRPSIEARLRHVIANSFRALGRFSDAEAHLTSVYEIRRVTLGEEHHETLRALANLAGLRLDQGRYADSIALGERAVGGLRRTLGDDHRLTLGAMNNLAMALRHTDRRPEAEALLRGVHEGQKRVLGATHPETIGSLTNLGALLGSLGRYDDAHAALRDAHQQWLSAHGADHPGALLAAHELAMTLNAMQRIDEAESLLGQVVAARERVFGEAHPDTLAATSNLAYVLSKSGRADESESLFVRSLSAARRVLGDTHPSTLITAKNLIELYEALGWPERSRAEVERTMDIFVLIADRPDMSADDLNACAWYLLTVEPRSARNPSAAHRAAERACRQERAAAGANLWMYLDTLAKAMHATGDPAGAAAAQREAVSLIPPNGERYRGEMEERLAEYVRSGDG
ncbi:MAG TPA: serine/threonine-protein kinase [Phycisphaerales bacterium]|nr:serine/threonine-protein kinase [Phycisphaerales bacterium]